MVFYGNIKNAYSYISVHYIDTMNNDGVNNGFSNGASNGSCVKGILINDCYHTSSCISYLVYCSLKLQLHYI